MVKSKKNGKARKTRTRVSTHPPPYKQQSIRHIKVRCTLNTDALLDQLTVNQLAALAGIHATTAISANYLSSQIRLNRVQMWATPAALGDTVNISMKWADSPLAASVGIANPPVSVEDTSNSVYRPAYISLRPGKNSLATNWFGAGATVVLLLVTVAANNTPIVIMDFDFSFVIDDIGTTNTLVISGGTAGVIYHKIMTGSTGLVYTPVPPLNSI